MSLLDPKAILNTCNNSRYLVIDVNVNYLLPFQTSFFSYQAGGNITLTTL